MSVPAMRQLSFRAVLLSIVLAMILAAANTYLGLFAGLTIATAIPAAVVSMALLALVGWLLLRAAGRGAQAGAPA